MSEKPTPGWHKARLVGLAFEGSELLSEEEYAHRAQSAGLCPACWGMGWAREQLIHVDGDGNMQSFWITPCSRCNADGKMPPPDEELQGVQ